MPRPFIFPQFYLDCLCYVAGVHGSDRLLCAACVFLLQPARLEDVSPVPLARGLIAEGANVQEACAARPHSRGDMPVAINGEPLHRLPHDKYAPYLLWGHPKNGFAIPQMDSPVGGLNAHYCLHLLRGFLPVALSAESAGAVETFLNGVLASL